MRAWYRLKRRFFFFSHRGSGIDQMADGPLVRKCAIIDGHGAGQGRSEGFGFMVRGDNKAPFGNVSRFLLLGCVCCSVGLAVDSMWCILMGYTPAFVRCSA